MAEYVSNAPVSRPLKLKGITPEVDLNGVMFSYAQGLCFDPVDEIIPMRLPAES